MSALKANQVLLKYIFQGLGYVFPSRRRQKQQQQQQQQASKSDKASPDEKNKIENEEQIPSSVVDVQDVLVSIEDDGGGDKTQPEQGQQDLIGKWFILVDTREERSVMFIQ